MTYSLHISTVRPILWAALTAAVLLMAAWQ